MRGFIDIWSFLSWGYRKRNDPPQGVAHAEDDLAGFPDDFWKTYSRRLDSVQSSGSLEKAKRRTAKIKDSL